jgi:hypothetical protein
MGLNDLVWVVKTNITGKQQKNANRRKKMEPTSDFLDNLAAKQHEKLIREVVGDNKNTDKDDEPQNLTEEA